MGRRVMLCASVLVLLSTSTMVQAQDDEYMGWFEQGFVAYQAKQYDEAILAWKKASSIRDEAILSFNIAKAHHKAGRLQEARAALDYALAAKTKPLSGAILNKAQVFGQQLEQELAQAEAARWQYRRWGTWRGYTGATLLGLGAVGLVLGPAYFGQRARQQIDELSYQDRMGYDEAQTQVKRLQTQGKVVLGVGIGLTLVGSGLLVWELGTTERYEALSVSAQGVSWQMSF